MDGEISENVNSNPKRKFTVWIIVITLFFVALIAAIWIWGRAGIAKTLTGFLIFLVIMSVIGLIVLLIIKLLFPPKVNMLAVVNKRIQQASEMRAPDVTTRVYLSGDNTDFERKYIGDLKGISDGVIPGSSETIINKKTGERTIKELDVARRILFLVVKKGAFSPKRIIGVMREDLTNPSMNELYIKDTMLGLPFGNVFYPKRYSGIPGITMAPMGQMVKTYTLEGMLKDFKVIIDDAIQSNPAHQKSLEQKGVMERIGEAGENND